MPGTRYQNLSSQLLHLTACPLRTGTTRDFSHYYENILDTKYIFVELKLREPPAWFTCLGSPGNPKVSQGGRGTSARLIPFLAQDTSLRGPLQPSDFCLVFPSGPKSGNRDLSSAVTLLCELEKSLPLSGPQVPYLFTEQVGLQTSRATSVSAWCGFYLQALCSVVPAQLDTGSM